MGWLKDSLIVLIMVLGIAAVAMGLQAGPGPKAVRGAVLTHLDSCAECRAELGHVHCPGMRRIRRGLTRRILDENPWMGDERARRDARSESPEVDRR